MNKELKPIVIQGAMDIEIEYFLKEMHNLEKVNVNNYEFYKGSINEYPVVISKTGVGVINRDYGNYNSDFRV